MQYKQIVKGQRDWLNQLNQALTYIGRPYETNDAVTLLNGWSNGEHPAKLKKFPLPSGATLVVFQFEAHNTLKPNVISEFATIPEDYKPTLSFLLGGEIPVLYGGHAGGYLDLYSVRNKIGFHFIPNNGNVDADANKSNDITIRGSVAWI